VRYTAGSGRQCASTSAAGIVLYNHKNKSWKSLLQRVAGRLIMVMESCHGHGGPMHAHHDRRHPAPLEAARSRRGCAVQSAAGAGPGTPIAAGRVAAGRGRRRLLTRRGPVGLPPMMLLAGFGTPPSALPVPVLAGVSTPPAGAVAVLLAWLTILLMTASGALPVPVPVAAGTPPSALVARVLVGASTQPGARPIPVPVGVGTPTQARPVPVLAGVGAASWRLPPGCLQPSVAAKRIDGAVRTVRQPCAPAITSPSIIGGEKCNPPLGKSAIPPAEKCNPYTPGGW
jgi:hypothetical protein